jgi:hypothetical protein
LFAGRGNKTHALVFAYGITVGNALDRACKLEAILRNLSHRKKELRLEQSHIDNQFIRMMNSLQVSLRNDEDLTVILGDTFSNISSETPAPNSDGEGEQPYRKRSSSIEEEVLEKPANPQRPTTPPVQNSRFGCFSTDVFDSTGNWQIPSPSISFSDAPSSMSFNVAPGLLPPDVNALLPSASHPSPSAMRAGALAWRERHSATQGINFRTGMSGHLALLSTHTRHPHDYLEPDSSMTNRLRMSSHTGLSQTRSKPAPGFLDSLTPSILRRGQEESRDQIPHAGSM